MPRFQFTAGITVEASSLDEAKVIAENVAHDLNKSGEGEFGVWVDTNATPEILED